MLTTTTGRTPTLRRRTGAGCAAAGLRENWRTGGSRGGILDFCGTEGSKCAPLLTSSNTTPAPARLPATDRRGVEFVWRLLPRQALRKALTLAHHVLRCFARFGDLLRRRRSYCNKVITTIVFTFVAWLFMLPSWYINTAWRTTGPW